MVKTKSFKETKLQALKDAMKLNLDNKESILANIEELELLLDYWKKK